jgi:hypothetical protein
MQVGDKVQTNVLRPLEVDKVFDCAEEVSKMEPSRRADTRQYHFRLRHMAPLPPVFNVVVKEQPTDVLPTT